MTKDRFSLGIVGFGPRGQFARERLLESLNPREQLVIRLLDLEENTIQETCNLTGWGASKVKVTAFRARKKLRQALQRLEAQTVRNQPVQ